MTTNATSNIDSFWNSFIMEHFNDLRNWISMLDSCLTAYTNAIKSYRCACTTNQTLCRKFIRGTAYFSPLLWLQRCQKCSIELTPSPYAMHSSFAATPISSGVHVRQMAPVRAILVHSSDVFPITLFPSWCLIIPLGKLYYDMILKI